MAKGGKAVALVFAFGGLAVGAFLFVRFSQTIKAPMALATSFAETSPEVQAALGSPLTFGRFPEAKVRPAQSLLNARIGIRVTGPRGTGKLVEWAQQNAGQWKLCSLMLHTDSDDTNIILVSGSATPCAREP